MGEAAGPGEPEHVRIPRESPGLYRIKNVRDEENRFAITYHRSLRDKKMTASVLDEVPGLGPARRTKLIKHFGSVKKLREQGEQVLIDLTWLPDSVARDLYAKLHGEVMPSTKTPSDGPADPPGLASLAP